MTSTTKYNTAHYIYSETKQTGIRTGHECYTATPVGQQNKKIKKNLVIIKGLLKKFEDFCTTTKLDSTRNSEHKQYIYILPKLKPGSLPLATELHQPGNHF